MKKIFALLVALLTACTGMLFYACSPKPTIGIMQFGSHPSLNATYQGILLGLEEGGVNLDAYNIDFHDGNFDPSVGGTQARSLVDKGSKLIIAIATPSAAAALSAADGSGIPVVYSAVSDPESAGFTQYENATGVSDVMDIENQLLMIKQFLPSAQKLGVLYSTTEANSLSQIEQLKTLAARPDIGLEIVEQAITNANELPAASDTLLAQQLDAITMLTDNTVVNYLAQLLAKIDDLQLGLPVFGSEITQVEAGALASRSLDYTALGKNTGLLAAQILLGQKSAPELEFLKVRDSFPCYSSEVLAKLGLTLPLELEDMFDVSAQD